jgi:hypothetical protein
MVSEKFITRLQAMNSSGELEGYLASQISKITLEPNWIVQGLTHNGLKGNIESEYNKKRFLIPMDLATRLMIDEGLDPKTGFGILMLGTKGLTERKFVVILRGSPQHLKALAFQTVGKYNPQDIIRLIIKYELDEVLSTRFVEPLSDYVEQIQIDSSDDKVTEALALKIPKRKFRAPDWIRDATAKEDSEYLLFKYGELNQVPPFSLLFVSWCLGLDLYKTTPDLLIAMTILGDNTRRAAIWDPQRNVAFFAILKNEPLEEIFQRYFLSLWISGKEKISPPIKTREVIIGSSETTTEQKKEIESDKSDKDSLAKDEFFQLQKTISHIQQRLDELQISELLIRLENIETRLVLDKEGASVMRHSDSHAIDSQSQERLREVISRLEALANRLEELDNRIHRISSKNME